MHDKYGRLIEPGDVIRGRIYEGVEVDSLGVVVSVHPGSTTCNVTAQHIVQRAAVATCSHTAKDVELVAKGDGSPLPPAA